MTKLTTAAVAAAIIGSVSLVSGAAFAATPSPTDAISASSTSPTWVMSKRKMMMMKKNRMMKKKMMMDKKGSM